VIYIVTLPNGYFGSAGASWKTLSPEKISKDLISKGYDIKYTSIENIISFDLKSDDIVVYTSSDDESIRAYVKDIIYLISKQCTVIPSLDALMAHENKGFQQIFREKNGFGDLKGSYFFHLDDAPEAFPFVYKTAMGAGSSGVELIEEKRDIKKIKGMFRTPLKRAIIMLARALKLNPEEFNRYKYRYKKKRLSVSQQYLPGLVGDYKILIFGKKIFILERKVSKGTFKASGSGLFSFPSKKDISKDLLNYAKSIHEKLDVPYSSLDIAKSDAGFHLIEYQATNFGPYTLVESPGHFIFENDEWVYISGSSDLEDCFSEAILEYIERVHA